MGVYGSYNKPYSSVYGVGDEASELADITHVGTTFGGNDVTTYNLNAPTGIQSGDLILAYSRGGVSNYVNSPLGFTLIGNYTSDSQVKHKLSYKIADGSESGQSFSFTQASALDCGVALSVYRNVSLDSGFVENIVYSFNASNVIFTMGPLSISSEKRFIISMGALGNSKTVSSISGIDGSYSLVANSPSSGDFSGIFIGNRNKISTITSETAVVTFNVDIITSGLLLSLVPKYL